MKLDASRPRTTKISRSRGFCRKGITEMEKGPILVISGGSVRISIQDLSRQVEALRGTHYSEYPPTKKRCRACSFGAKKIRISLSFSICILANPRRLFLEGIPLVIETCPRSRLV